MCVAKVANTSLMRDSLGISLRDSLMEESSINFEIIYVICLRIKAILWDGRCSVV